MVSRKAVLLVFLYIVTCCLSLPADHYNGIGNGQGNVLCTACGSGNGIRNDGNEAEGASRAVNYDSSTLDNVIMGPRIGSADYSSSASHNNVADHRVSTGGDIDGSLKASQQTSLIRKGSRSSKGADTGAQISQNYAGDRVKSEQGPSGDSHNGQNNYGSNNGEGNGRGNYGADLNLRSDANDEKINHGVSNSLIRNVDDGLGSSLNLLRGDSGAYNGVRNRYNTVSRVQVDKLIDNDYYRTPVYGSYYQSQRDIPSYVYNAPYDNVINSALASIRALPSAFNAPTADPVWTPLRGNAARPFAHPRTGSYTSDVMLSAYNIGGRAHNACTLPGSPNSFIVIPNSGCKFMNSVFLGQANAGVLQCAPGACFDLRICGCNRDAIVDNTSCSS